MGDSLVIATVGHSSRTFPELVEILTSHGVTRLVDIRKMPGSRAHPQFNGEALATALPAHGIDYVYLPELGGMRRRATSELNAAWRNRSFRAYADYMQTPEFAAGIDELIRLAGERATAIMCAEALPWRCHRSLVADALVVRGVTVRHLMSPTAHLEHTLRDFARVEGTRITYPATGRHDG